MNELAKLKSSRILYRDLIKTVNLVMDPKKKQVVKINIRREFEKNKSISDNDELYKLKKNAIKAITDLYVFYVKHSIKDDPYNPKEVKL
jgi:hypothetical protein